MKTFFTIFSLVLIAILVLLDVITSMTGAIVFTVIFITIAFLLYPYIHAYDRHQSYIMFLEDSLAEVTTAKQNTVMYDKVRKQLKEKGPVLVVNEYIKSVRLEAENVVGINKYTVLVPAVMEAEKRHRLGYLQAFDVTEDEFTANKILELSI